MSIRGTILDRARTLTAVGIVVLSIMLSSLVVFSDNKTPGARAQEGSEAQPVEASAEPAEDEVDFLDLYNMDGRILAEGRNATPGGPLQLTSYRVEELQLSDPIQIQIEGRTEQVQRAFRVVVTGGPFTVRGMPPVIWIGDVPLRHAQESVDLTELAVIVFDPSVLEEGATISVSYGIDGGSLSTIQERLNLEEPTS